MGNSQSVIGQGFLVACLIELQSQDDHGLDMKGGGGW